MFVDSLGVRAPIWKNNFYGFPCLVIEVSSGWPPNHLLDISIPLIILANKMTVSSLSLHQGNASFNCLWFQSCIVFCQINSRVSNTAPDLIVDEKPQSSQHSSRGGLVFVTGVATVALGAFLLHRAWQNTWHSKEKRNDTQPSDSSDQGSQSCEFNSRTNNFSDSLTLKFHSLTLDGTWQTVNKYLSICGVVFLSGSCKFMTVVKSMYVGGSQILINVGWRLDKVLP